MHIIIYYNGVTYDNVGTIRVPITFVADVSWTGKAEVGSEHRELKLVY